MAMYLFIYLFIYLSIYLFVLSHNGRTRLEANNMAGPSENRIMGRKKNHKTIIVNSGEENSPAALAGIRTRNLSTTSQVLYQQAIPSPKLVVNNQMVKDPLQY